MLTEDYFMRMINQILAVLTQILYHREKGQYQEAVLDYQRSLTFYLEISLSGKDRGLNDLDNKIDLLYLKLSGHEFPIEVRYLLFDYYEKRGDYLKVEDQI